MQNIALGKTSSQSSTLMHYLPTYANDGNRNGDYRTCAITTDSPTPSWWQVDLGDVAIIERIAVKTSEPPQACINPFDIRVGNDTSNGGINNPFCATSATLPPKEMKMFTSPTTMMGRYVSIHLNTTQFLVVCEVEVYGRYE